MKYQALETFEAFRRPSSMSIQSYLNEFEKRLFKIKSYGTTMSDDLLAYRLLKSANLSSYHEELIKATIPDLQFDLMKGQLKKTFSDASRQIPTKNEDVIKTEDAFIAETINEQNDQHLQNQYEYRETAVEPEYHPFREDSSQDLYKNEYETFYSKGKYRNYNQLPQQQYNQPSTRPRPSIQYGNRQQQQQPTHYQQQHEQLPKRGKNPCDRNGTQLRCYTCESIYHMAQNCPEKRDIYFTQEVVLFQSDFDHPSALKILVSDSWNSAVLDSGATNTVAGETWFNCFLSSLDNDQKCKVRNHEGNNIYRFGDGNLISALKNVDIPILLGNQEVMLNTDIVPNDIPLLLSRKSMKKADMTLDFKNDCAVIFGNQVQLITTQSGHYAIPICPHNTILNNVTSGANPNITLIATEENKSKYDIALKLHRQFAHPSTNKLLKLVNSAGEPWRTDNELKKLIKVVGDECQICQVYQKPPARPVVGLPMATRFQECVAMDLKFYKGKILLHLIDHATRLSASTTIPSKEPKHVINAILKHWIQIYGAPDKFLSDNGGEFANNDFMALCESMSITVKVAAAESPFRNGLSERQFFILADMIDIVLEESVLDFDLALAWCINAKNSLANVHGFSPFQLALGQNPKLPSTFGDKLPAHTPSNTCEILTDNLVALHSARQAFIESENQRKYAGP